MNELKEEGGSSIPTQRIRTKRCACNNFLDSECHYFCHLDIIWINTPSKTTLYGLGSILSRRRRSTGRCTCAKPDDRSCTSFCHHSRCTFRLTVHFTSMLIVSVFAAVTSNLRRSINPTYRASSGAI
uniref:Endothelin-like toxin domain-containing protein n=1 Tax=Echeneis naucrates TaxID=173247 RepID=A0A665UT36_ECHNA